MGDASWVPGTTKVGGSLPNRRGLELGDLALERERGVERGFGGLKLPESSSMTTLARDWSAKCMVRELLPCAECAGLLRRSGREHRAVPPRPRYCTLGASELRALNQAQANWCIIG